MERRLTAILAADVIGYSRLMGADEAGTLAALKKIRADFIDRKIGEHQGRTFKLIGDGMLAEFPSVVNAVACAAELQRGLQERNADVPPDRRIEFRVGVNLGDVIVDATGIFLTYLIPDTLLFIPLFQIVRGLGLLNSYWSMVLVYPTLTVPFCTWIMIGYFQSIPKELDEAAFIDGAGHMQMLFKIFIPVALPGIIAAMIFAFTVSWAAFVYPMAFLYSSDQQVLTVGTVTSLIRGDVYKWGMLMAGALLAAAPPLVIYAFLMDYYIAGLTAGATKG